MRMQWTTRALVLAAAVLTLATTAEAQARRGLVRVEEGGRAGFWGSFGLGAGREQLDLQDGFGYSDPLTKVMAQIKLGGTVNQNLRLGGEVFSWFNSDNGLDERVGHVAGIAQVYPAKSAGFYFKGAVGVAFSTVQLNAFNSVTDLGFSYGGGVGYEIPVGRRLFIVPTADFVQQSNSSGPQADFKERFLLFGLAIQFQSGGRF